MGGNFSCGWNIALPSLKGAPKVIDGDLDCSECVGLTKLEIPDTRCNRLFLTGCKSLTSLEGMPSNIVDVLDISGSTGITSLKGIHKQFKFSQRGTIFARNIQFKSHLLGVLLINGCSRIVLDGSTTHNCRLQDIINKYLEQPMSKQRMINCQNELIDAGFEEYAQL